MRRIASRVLLVALAVLAIVAAVRFSDGRGDAVVWMNDIDADRFRHERFEVERPARVVISASGSFEETRDVLAATAWVTDASGRVVWRLDPSRPARGTLASVTDTLALPAGEYDAYFASFGTGAPAPPPADGLRARLRRALSRGRAWRGDAGRWSLRVEGTDADREAVADLRGEDEDRAARGAVWSSGPVGNDMRTEELLRVSAPARVTLRAVLEATPDAVRDSAVVLRLGGAAPDTVWAFGYAGSEPAGGVARNRRADATLDLAPGLYRVAVQTGPRHAYEGWELNPPDAPWMWGLTVTSAAPDGAVTALVPSDKLELPVIASFACVGEDEDLTDTFTLRATTSALVVSAGEIIGSTAYDGGQLDRVLPSGGTEPIWVLDRAGSVAAGGDEKNRMGLDMVTLEPGTYRLRYTSDGSHHCDAFNSDPPDDPTFWGITLFALDDGFDPASVQRTEVPSAEPPAPDDASDGETDGPALAAIEDVRAGSSEAVGFRAPDSGRVLVMGYGAWSGDQALAYGWIEDAQGETVWSMRDADHAGAPMVFDLVELDEGAPHTLRYRTLDRDVSADDAVSAALLNQRSITVRAVGQDGGDSENDGDDR